MGASGCGKTTLISSLIGVTELDAGEIEIFGNAPRENKLRIGYMPQETALVSEFTIREILWFYGTIYGLSLAMIDEQIRFLSNLLELPDENRLIRECSGGQQRRVSFAISLIHDPELLILDEPTVGLDPLLRAKLWDYLVDVSKNRNVTVLLSTHYIEEARQSTQVGLMRNGILIAEDSPENVVRFTKVSHLEEAFLKLAIMQEHDNINQNSSDNNNLEPKIDQFKCQPPKIQTATSRKHVLDPSAYKIFRALLFKNFLIVLRNAE
jgi:ABC-type multidrug transport system ATPase subunit